VPCCSNAWQPLAFFSKKLNPAQHKYSAYDRELLAVYEAVKHFCHMPLPYTADLPTSPELTTATSADDTAVVAIDSDPAIASQKLQIDLLAIQDWFKKWRMKANESKSSHVTFTTRREKCPPVHINDVQFPQEDVKYLGLHLDRRLAWHKHIFAKRKHLGITLTKMYWLLDTCQNSLQATNFSHVRQYSS
jgi:hypothetical protein